MVYFEAPMLLLQLLYVVVVKELVVVGRVVP
jgi:hypothetical protein